jgi:hypothetical protein
MKPCWRKASVGGADQLTRNQAVVRIMGSVMHCQGASFPMIEYASKLVTLQNSSNATVFPVSADLYFRFVIS